MSATSLTSPTSPLETRDIRSATLPYKRDKNHASKWANGDRPLYGVHWSWNSEEQREELVGGNDVSRQKVRPAREWTSEYKSNANKAPKPSGVDTWSFAKGRASNRFIHKHAAIVDAKEHSGSQLSKSLIELLPEHVNNTQSAIHTAIREADGEILYSFDNKGPSPGDRGRPVDLGGLVERAEMKWLNEQTEKIVQGEYEVLDNEGETTVLKRGKKGSPKQKARIVAKTVDEDEDYELI